MNKLLVVVPYTNFDFCSSNTTRGSLGLQIHALESTFCMGIVVIKFNHIGCGVGGVLINDRWI